MRQLYEENADFREYVDRFAVCRGIDVSEALTHKMVHSYAEYLNDK